MYKLLKTKWHKTTIFFNLILISLFFIYETLKKSFKTRIGFFQNYYFKLLTNSNMII